MYPKSLCNLFYGLEKFGKAFLEAKKLVSSSTGATSSAVMREIFRTALARYPNQKLSFSCILQSDAMEPTLKREEVVLMRSCEFFSKSRTMYPTIFQNDIVLIEKDGTYYIRRVAAVEGDSLENSETGETYELKDNTCWVLSDKHHEAEKGFLDSRLWGPLHFHDIKGRALYGVRSRTDHRHLQTDDDMIRIHDMSITHYELSVEDLISREHTIAAV